MGEFLENLKRFRSRIGPADRSTAITAASIVIVLALVAVAFQSTPDETTVASETTSDASGTTTSAPGGTGTTTVDGTTTATGGRGAGTVSAPSAGTGGEIQDVPADVAITDTIIKVGLAYLEDPGTANAAAGFSGIGQLDQKRGWDALIKEINKNPPYGRKVVPVYYSYTTDDVTSKGAVILFTKSVALELAPHKIRVNVIAPAGADTPMLTQFFSGKSREEARAAFLPSIPLGRLIEADDVAKAALYLASDLAEMITGHVLEVDGGRAI